jgi:hypothetical protein
MNTYQFLFLSPTVCTLYHTSILTGEAWVYDLIYGHPDRIQHNLGVDCDVFNALLHILHHNGFVLSYNGMSVEEQLGTFLYTCVTRLSSCLVGERFQHSPDTITRYDNYIGSDGKLFKFLDLSGHDLPPRGCNPS